MLITSNVGGRYLDGPEFTPFWEEVNRRRVCVFMHPSSSPFYRDDQPATLLSFPFDTTLAAHNSYAAAFRTLSGRCPGAGTSRRHAAVPGTKNRHRLRLSGVLRRFATAKATTQRRDAQAPYLDTALGWNRGTFECARDLVGIDHIVFGTDYFLHTAPFMDWTSAFIDGLGLKAADRELIYRGTAARVLKLEG